MLVQIINEGKKMDYAKISKTFQNEKGQLVKVLKEGFPGISERERTMISDSLGNPIECLDVVYKKGEILTKDVYQKANTGSETILKQGVEGKGIKETILNHLNFKDLVDRFFK